MLKIENLHARIEGKDILKGLNLEVKPGEVHAIMGPNGSGKSTLANVLAGREEYEVTSGSVTYQGQRPLGAFPRRARLERHLPRLPISGGDPRREQHELPAHGTERDAQGERSRGARRQGFPDAGARTRQAGGDGPRPDEPQPERGLQRRREEAQRDLPDGDARTQARHPRRDRQRPGHRRAAHRGRWREQAAHDRQRLHRGDALPAAFGPHHPRLRARNGRWPHHQERTEGTGAGTGGEGIRLGEGARVMSTMTAIDPKATVLPLLEGSTWPGAAEALAQVNALPVPGIKTEAWKYTRVGKLFNQPYAAPNADANFALPARLPFDVTRVVFVNGRFNVDLSDDLKGDKGIVIDSLKHHLAHGPVKAHYGQVAPIGDRLFTAMNAAAPTNGLIILATKGTKTSKPIHVLHITSGDRQLIQPRDLFMLHEGAKVEVIIEHLGRDLADLAHQRHPRKRDRRRREPHDPSASERSEGSRAHRSR
ncbi:MAG: ATP-binding cassette domain-containing protein [Flavobacteriales bacterium]|nr:ATP-binding cassette domain-containing protein [Flavobacteriales bacterium]